MEVSIFLKEGIRQTIPSLHVPIQAVLSAIRLGRFKEPIGRLRAESNPQKQAYIKKSLPFFTASGTFTKRSEQCLLAHSGLIQLDFDKVPDPQALKRLISKEAFILACFVSPSGNGVKALAKVSPKAESHKEAFLALYSYFLDKVGIGIDTKTKDLSRACFVSYDEGIFINYEANTFLYSEPPNTLRGLASEFPSSDSEFPGSDSEFPGSDSEFPGSDSERIRANSERIPSETERTPSKVRGFALKSPFERVKAGFEERHRALFSMGNRNNYVYMLACACNRYGIAKEETLSEMLTRFPAKDFTSKEITQAVQSAYKNVGEFAKYRLH